MRMFLQDGTTAEFVAATLDPVAKLASLKQGAYHYLLCLSGRYTPESCPLYLTKAGYDELRKNGNQAVSTFRLHTATIMNVLRGLPDGALTKAILMDSQVRLLPANCKADDRLTICLLLFQDWFTPIDPATPLPPLVASSIKAANQTAATPERALEELKHELDLQIRELMRVMKDGGEVYYRSAGKKPWYNQRCGLGPGSCKRCCWQQADLFRNIHFSDTHSPVSMLKLSPSARTARPSTGSTCEPRLLACALSIKD